MKMTRRRLIIGLLLMVGSVYLIAMNFYMIRSMVVMWPYSQYHATKSLMKKNDYPVIMPTGVLGSQRKWHPLMLVFHDEDGFSNWMNEPWEISILYRFGAFGWGNKHSAYFDQNNGQFSSFYGAYLIQHKENPGAYYGFDSEKNLIPEDFMKITEYDQRFLVMPSLGRPQKDVTFEVKILSVEESVEYLGKDNWVKVDARIRTDSPQHHFKTHQRGYLQYGLPLPPPEGKEDFHLITLYGRIYATVVDSAGLTLVMYILAPDRIHLDEIDQQLLTYTVLPAE